MKIKNSFINAMYLSQVLLCWTEGKRAPCEQYVRGKQAYQDDDDIIFFYCRKEGGYAVASEGITSRDASSTRFLANTLVMQHILLDYQLWRKTPSALQVHPTTSICETL